MLFFQYHAALLSCIMGNIVLSIFGAWPKRGKSKLGHLSFGCFDSDNLFCNLRPSRPPTFWKRDTTLLQCSFKWCTVLAFLHLNKTWNCLPNNCQCEGHTPCFSRLLYLPNTSNYHSTLFTQCTDVRLFIKLKDTIESKVNSPFVNLELRKQAASCTGCLVFMCHEVCVCLFSMHGNSTGGLFLATNITAYFFFLFFHPWTDSGGSSNRCVHVSVVLYYRKLLVLEIFISNS